jgi:IclR family acetate operon transcriptional repressor
LSGSDVSSRTPAAKRDLVQSVRRACAILLALADERRALTPREVSEKLRLNLATCYHLLNTLEHEGFVQRDGSRRLRLGHRIGKLHDAFEASLKPDARLLDLLDLLSARTGETSYLGTWDGDHVVSVAVREGRGGVRVRDLYLGYRQHEYARALGRALLAHRDAEFIAGYVASTPLDPLTPHTTIDVDELLRCFAGVRELGYAVEEQEFTLGVCCAAAPIFGSDGRAVAAFSVSVPKARFDVDRENIVETVMEVAHAATQRLSEEREMQPERMPI